MDPVRNPYSPGAGLRPFELAGRDAEMARFDVLRARARQRRNDQSIVFYGLRGVGKTVLLNELAETARADGWIVAKVEADASGSRSPFRSQIAQSMNVALRRVQGKSARGSRMKAALRTFKSFSLQAAPDGTLSVGIELEADRGRADTGSLQADLTDLALDLGDAAIELDCGVALFIDEMQDLKADELSAVCQACHEAGQQNKPFFVVGAGLPNLPGILAEARSYAERLFHYAILGPLPPAEAAAALSRPAQSEKVKWAEQALAAVVAAANGYPYFLQEYGSAAWDVASRSPITRSDAVEGIRVGKARLDSGFFRSRWERATPGEREYLSAMAADGDGPSQSGEIARRLRKQPTQLGPVRARLIAKGLVFAPEHGSIAFTVPGMAEFIARQMAD
ncbi:MAG: ATP-binding protein [Ilumatobacteraceae bacterium]